MAEKNFDSEFEKVFPFYSELDSNEKEYLCENSVETTYKQGKTIHSGSECTGIIILVKGSLRVYMLSDEGKEITLFRLASNEMCTLSASCMMHSITFDVFVDAEEDSDCILISAPAYTYISDRHPNAKVFALETTVSSFSEVMWAMQQIMFMSMEKRLAIFLLDESANKSSDTVSLTHEQIAKYMGSAREVVSRTLKGFAQKGLVEVTRKGVKLLDKRGIRSIAY